MNGTVGTALPRTLFPRGRWCNSVWPRADPFSLANHRLRRATSPQRRAISTVMLLCVTRDGLSMATLVCGVPLDCRIPTFIARPSCPHQEARLTGVGVSSRAHCVMINNALQIGGRLSAGEYSRFGKHHWEALEQLISHRSKPATLRRYDCIVPYVSWCLALMTAANALHNLRLGVAQHAECSPGSSGIIFVQRARSCRRLLSDSDLSFSQSASGVPSGHLGPVRSSLSRTNTVHNCSGLDPCNLTCSPRY